VNHDELAQGLEALHPASYGWAVSCCGWRSEDAEDVLQLSYMKILSGEARFDGRATLKTFVFAVIRRTAAEQRRRRWIRQLALARWWEHRPVPRPSVDPETTTRNREMSRRLVAALQELPRRQRELLHLVFYQDLTVEEAAGVLDVSAGTARTHFDRGKKRLRQLLETAEMPR
jgi:RNA polymerase sigma-70 factor (ECF subfamily)